jgi:hypothetical protein
MNEKTFEVALRGAGVNIEFGVKTTGRIAARRNGDGRPQAVISMSPETMKAEFIRIAFHASDVA